MAIDALYLRTIETDLSDSEIELTELIQNFIASWRGPPPTFLNVKLGFESNRCVSDHPRWVFGLSIGVDRVVGEVVDHFLGFGVYLSRRTAHDFACGIYDHKFDRYEDAYYIDEFGPEYIGKMFFPDGNAVETFDNLPRTNSTQQRSAQRDNKYSLRNLEALVVGRTKRR